MNQITVAKITLTTKNITSHHIFASVDGKVFSEVRKEPKISEYKDLSNLISAKYGGTLPMRFTKAYLETIGAVFSVVK